MNITIFGLYSYYSPHFEVELELAELHLEKGDRVTFITCDAILQHCEPNQDQLFKRCLHCMGRAKGGLDLLKDGVKIIPLSELILPIREKLNIVAEFFLQPLSYESLSKFKIDNFEVGLAVLSSLNDYTLASRPDPAQHLKKTREMVASALACYYAMRLYLTEYECDELYVFNGRLANMRGAIRACDYLKIPYVVHERGADLYRYMLSRNTLPHDPKFMGPYLQSIAAQASQEDKETGAKLFYTERKQGVATTFVPFTKDQKEGLVVEGWQSRSPRIAVYTSTEYEFASLQELLPTGLYKSQFEGLLAIIHDLQKMNFSGIFAVRTHPNSFASSSDFSADLLKLNHPFLKVIAPKDPVDSYALLHTSDKVLTFGSTLGIEAAYWGKPSILAGWALYENFGSTYDATSHENVMELLLNDLKPKSKDGAINYGYAFRNYGDRFRYFKPTGLWNGFFKGSEVKYSDALMHLWPLVVESHPQIDKKFSEWNSLRLNYVYGKT